MPQAAAHIIIPLLLMSLVRDYFINRNGRKSFPLHYVLIAGISGIIPDLDVLAYWVLYFFGFAFSEVHRTFMHTLFVPIIFLLLSLATMKTKVKTLGKHKLKLNIIFLMMALGSFIHLVLDVIFQGSIMPLYPFSYIRVGLDLFGYLPTPLANIAAPSLDAGIIILYLIYLEWRHKISDFV